MNISFETTDKVNGHMTIVVEEADFKADVDKQLKSYRKRANIPGFRPGMAPLGMIKRQYEAPLKADVINKLLGEQLQKYIEDNKIQMLGQPLAHEGGKPVDLEKAAPYTFEFDIAVAPEFEAKLTADDTLDYYDITVDDALIDKQVEMFASRAGHYDKAEEFDPEKRDMLKGDLRELDAEGNTLEGGLTIEGAVLMPQYIKEDEQKNLFNGAKLGDIITWNPRKAYPENDSEIAALLKIEKEQVAEHTGDFSYQITEVQRFVPAEVNAELWEGIYGKESGIKDESGFREAISKGLKLQLANDSDFKFIQDVRTYVEKQLGELTFPDALLKRIMLANNQDKGEDFVEQNYAQSIKELTWSMAKEQLAVANGIKVDDNDVKEAAKEMARAQFAMYGMNNVPDEYLEQYANDQLKKREAVDSFVGRALDKKLSAALKTVVKLNHKEICIDDFNKLVEA